tara:strand:+ start:410 stop:664 length:255 start_codon:yes stop_codon:yes gene_type:complete
MSKKRVYLDLNIVSHMSNYWPSRKNPEGFSIERLAKSYKERISGINSNISIEKNYSQKYRANSLVELSSCHWANRSFDEYRIAS